MIHFMYCSFCGAELARLTEEIEYVRIVPPCPRCKEQTWLHSATGTAVVWPGAQ